MTEREKLPLNFTLGRFLEQHSIELGKERRTYKNNGKTQSTGESRQKLMTSKSNFYKDI